MACYVCVCVCVWAGIVFALSLMGICTIFIYMVNISRFKFLPDSISAIMIGMLVGLMVRVMDVDNKVPPLSYAVRVRVPRPRHRLPTPHPVPRAVSVVAAVTGVCMGYGVHTTGVHTTGVCTPYPIPHSDMQAAEDTAHHRQG